MENPKFRCKVIESKDAEEIISEIDTNGEEVRYIEGIRYVKKLMELPLNKDEENKEIEIRDNGVYLITGGAGGLGLIFAKHLANKTNIKLVLTGRSNLTPEKQIKIDEIRSLGSEVIYIKTDISNKDHLQELIKTIYDKFGNINGVIHSAGIIHDAFIIKKTKTQIEEVIKPKIFGIKYLYSSLRDFKLDFIICFSSAAGIFGNVGQCDYAYANSYMNNFAIQNKGIISINWSFWKDGGMKVDKEIEKMVEKTSGILPLQKDNGIKAFNTAIIKSEPEFIVLEGNINKIKKYIEPGKQSTDKKRTIQSAKQDDLLEKIKSDLLKEVSKILKINESDIDIESDLSDFGFDSITFTQFSNKINDLYKININPSIFFEYQTLQSFSKCIIESYSDKLHEFYGTTINTIVDQPESRNKTSSQAIEKRDRFINEESRSLTLIKNNFVKEPIDIINLQKVSKSLKNFKSFLECCSNRKRENLISIETFFLLEKHIYDSAIHMLVTTESGNKIEMFIAGKGQPVLLLPAFGCTIPQWYFQYKNLVNKYKLIVMNFPGVGLSDFIQDISFIGIVNQFIEILNKLEINYPIHVIGTSFGGVIGQYLASTYKDKIASLTLIGSTYQIEGNQGKVSLRERIKDDFENNKINKKYYDMCLKSECSLNISEECFREFMNFSTIDILNQISAQTLIIAGSNDLIFNTNDSHILYKNIKNSIFYEIPDSGHLPNITHHNEVNKKIIEFIESAKKSNKI